MSKKYSTIFHFLSAEFTKAKIPFLLVGGFAVNYYKATRVTQDLDLLICYDDFGKASTLLEKNGGYQKKEETSLFARFDSDDPAISELDLIFVDRKTMDGFLKEAKQTELEGQNFKVPSLEYLIALKLHSIKHNPNREHRDLFDIIELIKRNQVDFHAGIFKQLCLKYGPEKIHDKISEALKTWKS